MSGGKGFVFRTDARDDQEVNRWMDRVEEMLRAMRLDLRRETSSLKSRVTVLEETSPASTDYNTIGLVDPDGNALVDPDGNRLVA